jgi:geranylgeranyl reductase family protein
MNFDVIIAGAGSAGSLCARECAELGLETLVLEEHSFVGKQRKCTALVSKNGLELLDVDFAKSVLNEVCGARFYSSRFQMRFRSKQTQACVLDRQKFDEQCAFEAKRAGAQLRLKTRVLGVKQTGEGVAVKTNNGVFRSKLLVGCDGVSSTVASCAGFPQVEKIVVGWETEFEKAVVSETDSVNLFFDSVKYPGFFAWLVPVSQTSCRVGVAVKGSSLEKAKNSVLSEKIVANAIAHAKKTREFTHAIPISIRENTQAGRILLAGDAAGQVKATTGGGVVFGGLCAFEAANSAKRFLDGGSLDYEKNWRAKCGKTLALHYGLRKTLNSLDNDALDACFLAGKLFATEFLLSNFGDMEFILKR